MADKDIHQHVAEGKASERVAEKAKIINQRLADRPALDAESLRLEPRTPTGGKATGAKK